MGYNPTTILIIYLSPNGLVLRPPNFCQNVKIRPGLRQAVRHHEAFSSADVDFFDAKRLHP